MTRHVSDLRLSDNMVSSKALALTLIKPNAERYHRVNLMFETMASTPPPRNHALTVPTAWILRKVVLDVDGTNEDHSDV